MSSRAKAWWIGLISTALVATMVRDGDSPGLRITLTLLGLAVSALVAEGLALGPKPRGRREPDALPGALPADGIIDVVPVLEVEGIVNSSDARFRRYVSSLMNSGEPSRIVSMPTTNPRLLGRVVLFSVFVGRDGVGWTDPEIARGFNAVTRAGLWLEREAIRWSAPVNIALADVYFQVQDDDDSPIEVGFIPEGGDVGPLEAHASLKAVAAASRASKLLGFADVVDFFGRMVPRVDAHATAWLFHIRRSGRSLAIPPGDGEIPGVGFAYCYARESSFPEPIEGSGRVDPTTIVHELLHLFGGSDKYGIPLSTFPARSVTSRDIMRLNHDTLARMTIDVLTGMEIGWNPTGTSSRPIKENARR